MCHPSEPRQSGLGGLVDQALDLQEESCGFESRSGSGFFSDHLYNELILDVYMGGV